MTTVALMQPYLFPYIGYWQLIGAVDTFIIYDDVNYIKGGWINRNIILLNGTPHFMTLSLNKASPYRKIADTEIVDTPQNRNRVLGLIDSAYRKAPFFKDVYPLVKEIYFFEQNNLAAFLENHIRKVCDYLGIKTRVILSSSIDKNPSFKAADRVKDICIQAGATTYINPIGGQELYDRDDFMRSGLDLKFLKSQPVVYEQFEKEFLSHLSIIDLMMFNDKMRIQSFLSAYELV